MRRLVVIAIVSIGLSIIGLMAVPETTLAQGSNYAQYQNNAYGAGTYTLVEAPDEFLCTWTGQVNYTLAWGLTICDTFPVYTAPADTRIVGLVFYTEVAIEGMEYFNYNPGRYWRDGPGPWSNAGYFCGIALADARTVCQGLGFANGSREGGSDYYGSMDAAGYYNLNVGGRDSLGGTWGAGGNLLIRPWQYCNPPSGNHWDWTPSTCGQIGQAQYGKKYGISHIILYGDPVDDPTGWYLPFAEESVPIASDVFAPSPLRMRLIGQFEFVFPASNPDTRFVTSIGASPVHSATDGVVSAIYDVNWDDCADDAINYVGYVSLYCAINVEDGPTPYLFEYEEAQIVEITLVGETESLLYLVNNADEYIEVGSVVAGGCTIGEAIYAFSQANNSVFAYLTMIRFDKFSRDETLSDLLVEYPPEVGPCDGSNPDGCLNDDPYVSAPGAWSGTAEITGLGAFISPRETLSKMIDLDPSSDYTVTFVARGDQSTITTEIVNADNFSEVQRLTSQDTIYSYQFTTSANNVLTTIKITSDNLSFSDVVISYLCITLEGSEPPQSPGSCYFSNPSFDLDGASWDSTGGVSFANGAAYVPSSGTLSQSVNLLTNGGAAYDYKLSITFADFISTVSTGSLTYTWGGSPVTITSSITANATATSTINVTANTNQTMVFTLTAQDGSSNPLTIPIARICISGPFPGQEGGIQDVFEEDCEGVTPPAGDGVRANTLFLWNSLDAFFSCDLMRILNEIYQVSVRGLNMTSNWFRYGNTVLLLTWQWIGNGLIPWMEGYAANMIAANGGGAASTNIFDVLLGLLEFLSPLVDLLLSAVYVLIDLLALIIQQAITLWLLAQSLLASLITAYSTATPQPLPYTPDCTNPQSSGWCVGIWILDNTIFAPDSLGRFYVDILIGSLSVSFIVYTVNSLRKSVMDTSGAA